MREPRAAAPAPPPDDEEQRGLACALAAHRQATGGGVVAGKQTWLLETQGLGVGLARVGLIPGAGAALVFEGAREALCGAAGDVGHFCSAWHRQGVEDQRRIARSLTYTPSIAKTRTCPLSRSAESVLWMAATAPVCASATLASPRCFLARRRSERESSLTKALTARAHSRLS